MELAGINLSQNSNQLEKIYNDFLNQMINDYVLLYAAEQDTNIIIDNNMVDLRLNEYMKNLINEVGTEEKLSSVFNKSIREIKYYYREQIYNAMLREMYVYSYLNDLDISRKEVENFYVTYQDSLPNIPAQYTFSIIEIPIIPGKETINKINNLQTSLLDSINNGVSFSSLAKNHSQDTGTAPFGGDQGYYKRGTLFPEFENIAFDLQINEVSKSIRSPIGFHIIKLLDKKGDQIHTQHILSLLEPSSEDKIKSIDIAENIYKNTINDPGQFDSLSIEYQNQHKNKSGVYNDYELVNIDYEIQQKIINNKEYTSIPPTLDHNNNSHVLIYLYKIKQSKTPTLENSWIAIEKYAKNKKESDLLIKLIEKLKHNIFIQHYN